MTSFKCRCWRGSAVIGVKFLGEPHEIRLGVFAAHSRGAKSEMCEMREIT